MINSKYDHTPDIITLASNGVDLENNLYTKLYFATQGSCVLNGTTFNGTAGLVIDVIVIDFTYTSGEIYLLGIEKPMF